MGILQPSEPIELPDSHKWHFEKVKACVSVGPYLIGAPPLAFECHHPGTRTLPCYRFLKGCTLDCPRCRFQRQYVCYVPLLDISNPRKFRIVVAGGKRTWLSLKGIEVGTLVRMSRGALKRDTIMFKATGEKLEVVQEKIWRARCQEDIAPYLFHLWQQRELTEHFGQPYFPSLRVLENDDGKPSVPRLEDLRDE